MGRIDETVSGSKLLREWLSLKRVKVKQLAAIVGVSSPAVSQWLNGNTRPGYRVRLILQDETGVPAWAWDTMAERERWGR